MWFAKEERDVVFALDDRPQEFFLLLVRAELQQLCDIRERDTSDLIGDCAIAVGKLLDHHRPRDNSAVGTAPLGGSADAMKTEFPDSRPYVGGYRLVFIPLQDVGENFGPDEPAGQIADSQLIVGEEGRTRRGGIMLHGWTPLANGSRLLIKHHRAFVFGTRVSANQNCRGI